MRSALLWRLRSLATSIREIVLRRRLHPEDAWDARARQAPDWFIAYARSEAEADALAEGDLGQVLAGLEPRRLHAWTILEIGCGAGRLLKALAPLVRQAFGVDISAEMVRLAHARLSGLENVAVYKNDGRTLGMFPDETIDFVFSINVFRHIPERSDVASYLREVHRVLRPGGEAHLQADGRGRAPHWRFFKRTFGDDSWAGIFFTRAELVELVRGHGLEIISCRYLAGSGPRRTLEDLVVRARKPQAGAARGPSPPR